MAVLEDLTGDDEGEVRAHFSIRKPLNGLFQASKFPEQKLYLTNALQNLTRVYAYRLRQHQKEPMRPKEIEMLTRQKTDLSNTLKMIFRI